MYFRIVKFCELGKVYTSIYVVIIISLNTS
jgi:hypothetical protein